MVSSAVYRYFASRDELLTALIIDAYNGLGAAAEASEAAVDRADLAGRLAAVCHAVRDWALANPHEYALIYGTPVPGYVAPQDTIGPASRVSDRLHRIIVDGVGAGIGPARSPATGSPAAVPAETGRISAQATPASIPPSSWPAAMIAWTELFGAVSFEVFGRLDGMIVDRATPGSTTRCWRWPDLSACAPRLRAMTGTDRRRVRPAQMRRVGSADLRRTLVRHHQDDRAAATARGSSSRAKECQAGWAGGNRDRFEARATVGDAADGAAGLRRREPVGWCAAGPRARFERALNATALRRARPGRGRPPSGWCRASTSGRCTASKG